MKKTGETVLLYQFNDERRAVMKEVLKKLDIPSRTLREDAFQHKIGYLLGLRGFGPTSYDEDAKFEFPHEVLILHGIKNKRLDILLAAMKEADIKVDYKAITTPFNTLWTLERLCETMEKEHAYMMARSENKVAAPASTDERLDAVEEEELDELQDESEDE